MAGTPWKTKQSSEWFGNVVIRYRYNKETNDIEVQKIEVEQPQSLEHLTRMQNWINKMIEAHQG